MSYGGRKGKSDWIDIGLMDLLKEELDAIM